MNKNERLTFEKYRRLGIILNRKGWPDSYYFSDGRLTVVETKAGNDDLTFEQQAVRDFLIAHGVRYIVEYVKDGRPITVFDSDIHASQTKPTQSGPARTTPIQTTPNQTRPNHSGPDPTSPNRATPDRARPFQSKPFQTSPPQTRPNHTNPVRASPYQTEPNQSSPDHTRPNRAIPVQSNPDHTSPFQTRPTQSKPNKNPGEAGPGALDVGGAKPTSCQASTARARAKLGWSSMVKKKPEQKTGGVPALLPLHKRGSDRPPQAKVLDPILTVVTNSSRQPASLALRSPPP